MASTKTIAIIGATGSMGSAIAKKLAGKNHRLLLMGKNEEKQNALFGNISQQNPTADVERIGCLVDASWEADIIIVAVPYNAEKAVAEKIRDFATGKIVISISNPLNETFTGLVTEPHTSAAEELQELLPHSKVVKAFNTVFAGDFEQQTINGQTPDVFIAGNDEEALETVSQLVANTGFNPVVAGTLKVSRTLESMTALLIQLSNKYQYNWLAGWKILHN